MAGRCKVEFSYGATAPTRCADVPSLQEQKDYRDNVGRRIIHAVLPYRIAKRGTADYEKMTDSVDGYRDEIANYPAVAGVFL